MKIRVVVTEDDIRQSVRGDEALNPICLALRRRPRLGDQVALWSARADRFQRRFHEGEPVKPSTFYLRLEQRADREPDCAL